jgi:hypothetical protein
MCAGCRVRRPRDRGDTPLRTATRRAQADFTGKISYSESLIAQETCRRAPPEDLARALDKMFATPGFTEETPDSPGTPGTFGRLAAKLRNLPFPASFRSFAAYEAEAVALHVFEHSLIPGLLRPLHERTVQSAACGSRHIRPRRCASTSADAQSRGHSR